MKAVKGKEIILKTENKVGKLGEVSNIISDNGINIRSVSAWAVGSEAFIRLLTSDINKTKDILKSFGDIEEKEVVIVEMPDEIGQLTLLTSQLKESNVNLTYIYGTTSELGKPAIIVFSSADNNKALEIISE